MSHTTVCHCGHDRDTHFEKKGACLGFRCDACRKYVNERDPKLPSTKPAPPPTPAPFDTTDDPAYGYPFPFGPWS